MLEELRMVPHSTRYYCLISVINVQISFFLAFGSDFSL